MKKATPTEKIRNVAIIAHVDHGKTTLVDAFLKQSNIFRENQEEMSQEQILDFNELERERGITIKAKNASIPYKGYRINIIDTPGHADFGGEVERTLSLAEGCLLLVDAQEGVMPQTRFVLKKALELNLKPIVVINKIDKKYADASATLSKIQDLFLDLATDMSILDFKTFYSISRDGKVFSDLPKERGDELSELQADTSPVLDEIVTSVPAPTGDPNGEFQMQVSLLDFDQHLGRYAIGKVKRGSAKKGDSIVAVNSEETDKLLKGTVKAVNVKEGLEYEEIEEATVGEIVAISGLEEVQISDTICATADPEALPIIKISPPSLKIKFEANTSPLLGKEGKFANLKQLQTRLEQESQTNASLKIEKNSDGSYYVSGRGELHLGILIETLRREGYEFQIRKPEVIITEVEGVKTEPLEEVYIEIPDQYYSDVTQEVNARKGALLNIERENGVVRMTYTILTRNLIGLRRLLLTATKGNLVMNNHYLQGVKYEQSAELPRKGRIISSATGQALAYALNMIQERGQLFITPMTEVYEGMVIGINKYDDDISVNPLKAREKSNVRVSSAVVTDIALKTPIQLTLEFAIAFLAQDEILEVTPKSLRIRKKFLNKTQEYLAGRGAKKK